MKKFGNLPLTPHLTLRYFLALGARDNSCGVIILIIIHRSRGD